MLQRDWKPVQSTFQHPTSPYQKTQSVTQGMVRMLVTIEESSKEAKQQRVSQFQFPKLHYDPLLGSTLWLPPDFGTSAVCVTLHLLDAKSEPKVLTYKHIPCGNQLCSSLSCCKEGMNTRRPCLLTPTSGGNKSDKKPIDTDSVAITATKQVLTPTYLPPYLHLHSAHSR